MCTLNAIEETLVATDRFCVLLVHLCYRHIFVYQV